MTQSVWASQHERGSPALVRLMIWLTLTLGWPVGQALLVPITAYFVALSPAARAASRGFLARALGRPPTLAEIWRHFFTFAGVTLDRLFMLTRRLAAFRVDVTGLDSLKTALADGRGCMLLGSHLGSFEALRVLADQCPVRVRPLMYRANAAAFTRLMARLNPGLARDVIEIGTLGAMLELRESVDRGEIVGILADRVPGAAAAGAAAEKTLRTGFLGAPAAFPTGPIVVAALLGVPTFLFFAVRTGPRRYRNELEPFADPIVLRRASRAEDLRLWVGRYAARLERHARQYPYNWFNFFDFWGEPRDASGAPAIADPGLDGAALAPRPRGPAAAAVDP
jgi:predicted LPLAT superfamily acyltransferase